VPSVVRECRYGRIEGLRVEALSLVRHPGEREGVRDGQCDTFVIS
jgi:hypothetical protein